MSIFGPREPPVRPDPPDPIVRVTEIDMLSVKRDITATVRVQNHYGWNTRGVTVTGTWSMPRGKTGRVGWAFNALKEKHRREP